MDRIFWDGKLKKVSVTGGAAVTLCEVADDRGGTWAEDDSIFFTPNASSGTPLFRVPSAGGKPEPATKLDAAAGERTHRWPQALPGGRAVLFTAHAVPNDYEDANIIVWSPATGEKKVVQHGGYNGRYLPSSHLIYVHQGTLFAAPFNLDRFEVTGEEVPVLENVLGNSGAGSAHFAFSGSGSFVYVPLDTPRPCHLFPGWKNPAIENFS